jgi:hypothetical protein
MSTYGAFVYFESDPISAGAAFARSVIDRVLSGLFLPASDVQMSLFKTPFKEGRWRSFQGKALDDSIANPEVETVNFIAGLPRSVFFTAKLQLRSDPEPRRRPTSPLRFSFVCEAEREDPRLFSSVATDMLRLVAEAGRPISGGVFSAQIFNQANCEVDDTGNCQQEPQAYKERNKVDCIAASDRWKRARRLYPITLLGPKLACEVTAAEARAAGALAVEEINGSLLIDAYPIVVETWDPEFLRATVELRRWLWPHTIQNPADAVGLGLKLPGR